LSRADKITLESICSAAKDDYADEIEELSVYEKCGWLQDKIKSETGIVLENVGIELELMMRL